VIWLALGWEARLILVGKLPRPAEILRLHRAGPGWRPRGRLHATSGARERNVQAFIAADLVGRSLLPGGAAAKDTLPLAEVKLLPVIPNPVFFSPARGRQTGRA